MFQSFIVKSGLEPSTVMTGETHTTLVDVDGHALDVFFLTLVGTLRACGVMLTERVRI
jgi:hypothetical protein